MRSRRPLLLLFLAASLAFLLALPSPTFAATGTGTPNELEIARTPGLHNVNHASREVVLDALEVQQLYAHMLGLPVASTDMICPQYLIASYRLTFFHNSVPILQVKAVDGLCHPVIFGDGDIRAADDLFWKLLQHAQDIGLEGPPLLK